MEQWCCLRIMEWASPLENRSDGRLGATSPIWTIELTPDLCTVLLEPPQGTALSYSLTLGFVPASEEKSHPNPKILPITSTGLPTGLAPLMKGLRCGWKDIPGTMWVVPLAFHCP